MSKRPCLWETTVLALCCYFLLCPPAQAYFDLATGTYMIQMTMAMLVSLWLSLRYKFFNFIKPRKTSPDNKTEPPKSEETAEPE